MLGLQSIRHPPGLALTQHVSPMPTALPVSHSPEVVAFLNAEFLRSLLSGSVSDAQRAIAPVWEPVSRERTGETEASCTYALANRSAYFCETRFPDGRVYPNEPVEWVTVGRGRSGQLCVWMS